MINKIFIILRWALSLVFLAAGIIKLFNINNFIEIIYQLVIIPDSIAPTFAYIIVAAEIIVGTALIFKWFYYITLRISLSLIIVFTVIVTIKLFEGADVSCGCFGDFGDNKIDFITFLRNIGLLLINFLLLVNFEYDKHKNETYFVVFRKIGTQLLIILLFFFLAFQNLTFLIQNVELKNRVETLTKKQQITLGDTVQNINLITASGNIIEYEFNNNNTLIFVMKAGCKPCEQNINTWKEIAGSINNDTKVIGISVDPLPVMNNYVLKNEIFY